MKFTAPKRLDFLRDSMIRMMTIEAIRNDAINMGQGYPEFDLHPEIIASAQKLLSMVSSNQYSDIRGHESLRCAIAEKYRRAYDWAVDPEEEVTITCGVTEAMVAAILATVETGDKVVIIEPAHENYLVNVILAGGIPMWVPLTPPNFALDLDGIERAFKDGAKHIIINSPHNPTGRVFTRAELKGLSELCVRYDIIAVTDEIYEHIIYDGKLHTPIALMPGMAERTITTSGIGKTFSLTGWRIGYAIAPRHLSQAILRLHMFLSICAPTPLQIASIAAFDLPESYFRELNSKYDAARRRMMEILSATGFKAQLPEGAYYIMADFSSISSDDDVTFSMKLVKERRVAVIPGSSFYANREYGRNLVRFAFPKPLSVLDEVMKRLSGLGKGPMAN